MPTIRSHSYSMHTGRVSTLAAMLLALATVQIAAQAPARSDSVARLSTITVTATRTPSPLLLTPLAITKLTAEDLRRTTGYGVDQALAGVPGVIARSRYGTSDVQLMIRGFGARGAGDRSNTGSSRGVRVLIDGFPETEPDGRTALDQVDLGAASSIEVVRSNAAAVWGNAAGGVVNVITVPSVTRPTGDLQALFGAFGLQRYTARVAGPLGGDGTAYATFTNTTFDGWRAHSSSRRALFNSGVVGTISRNADLGVFLVATSNLMHQPGPLTRSQMEADPRQAHAGYVTRDERRHNKTGRLGMTLDYRAGQSTVVSASAFINPKYQQRSERNTYRDFTRYHIGGSLLARTDFLLGAVASRLTVGADDAYQDGAILFYNLTPSGGRGTALQQDKGEGNNTFGVFAQDRLTVTDRLSLLLGARYDYIGYYFRTFLPSDIAEDTRTYSRVTPKIGATWSLDRGHALYANIGGGIEVPASNESDPTPGTTEALLNHRQDPILSTTYEVGLKASASPLGQSGVTAGYDVALYDIEVRNDAIPYNSGRYYLTAGRSRRSGLEVGVNATSTSGVFGSAALTLSRNRYLQYVVDSTVIFPNDPAKAGARADYSGNETVGIPGATVDLELGTALPGVRKLRLSGHLRYSGRYFADDANAVTVPSYTTLDLQAALAEPIVDGHGWGVRGFVTVANVTNAHYVAASFLNPDLVGGEPAAFQPGLPRSVTVTLSVGHM